MAGPIVITRNDPFSKSSKIRSRLAAIPDYQGVTSTQTTRKVFNNLAAGATTLYAVSTVNKRARFSGGIIWVSNATGAGITADFHHVPSGGAAAATNKIATVTVAANTGQLLVPVAIWHVLGLGSALVINPGGAGLNVWFTFLLERPEACAYDVGFIGNLAAANTTVYTAPPMHTVALRNIVAYNSTAGALTLTANSQESGVAVTTATQLLTTSIAAGATFTVDLALQPTLSENGTVTMKGSGTGLNVWVNSVLY